MDRQFDHLTKEIKDAFKKAAWRGFSRSMRVGGLLQASLFILAPVIGGITLLWQVLFGFTALVMLGFAYLANRHEQLKPYIFVFLTFSLALGQIEAFVLLWSPNPTVAVIAIINLIAGFSILSLPYLIGFLLVTTLTFIIWVFTHLGNPLLSAEASIYLISFVYSLVIHFRYKNNLLQQFYHSWALEERTQELELLQQKYERLSQIDELTTVYNRRYFVQEAERYIALAKRHKLSFSILLFDLDHFKAINDTFGHMAGDMVLVEVARRVKETLRESDVFARYGGEEFVVLLPFTGLEQTLVVAERLRKLIAVEPIISEQGEIWVSSSFGLAIFDETFNLEIMLNRADEALYRAKEQGRNRIEVAGLEPLEV